MGKAVSYTNENVVHRKLTVPILRQRATAHISPTDIKPIRYSKYKSDSVKNKEIILLGLINFKN